MIFPLMGLVLGALLGALGARRRGGKRLDLLQWAGSCAIMGAMLGLFVLIVIERSYAS